MNITTILILSFIIITLSFVLNYSHLLISLLYLEAITLCIVLFIPATLSSSMSPIHQLRLMLLTFRACEARIGLSLIVILSRTNGTDILISHSLNKC